MIRVKKRKMEWPCFCKKNRALTPAILVKPIYAISSLFRDLTESYASATSGFVDKRSSEQYPANLDALTSVEDTHHLPFDLLLFGLFFFSLMLAPIR